ncbi:hypothetical protein ERJ75_001208800 [Trypanosoma vivax]|nr:hypothetical protein ERJ75_001208800 [Trypanosoma vivax]
MLRQHKPQQPSVVILLATNGARYCDRLLRHVRAFRVYDRSCFALVPSEPRLALEDAMALPAYKFLLLLFLLHYLGVAVGCALNLRGAAQQLLFRVFLYHVLPWPSVYGALLRAPGARGRVPSSVVRSSLALFGRSSTVGTASGGCVAMWSTSNPRRSKSSAHTWQVYPFLHASAACLAFLVSANAQSLSRP